MRIGDLARMCGVSADTIRYYERIGLMPRAHRTESGYRQYPESVSRRLRVIRNAIQLGFPLKEIAKILTVRDAGGAPCRQVRDYAAEIANEIDRRIRELKAERREMLAMIRDWDGKLATVRPGSRAHLLDGETIAARAKRARQARLRRSS